MAKALKCDQCGTLLRNVAEAQNHGEVTGHSKFSETTEVIRVMKCTSCGKPCRSVLRPQWARHFIQHGWAT
jgi:hypothetical protein